MSNASQTQLNVLLICVDHWPGPLLRTAGHSHVFTPTLDQLCRNGVRYANAYSTTPTCIPARRALMTGTTAKTHGDRTFREFEPMDPSLPTMAQTFRDAGHQAYAVGKLHVYPQRDRIGFDDVLINEESRHHLGGGVDDYERYLSDHGYAGQELTHGIGNNSYVVRPWHLPEQYHQTFWATRQMCETIRRRDPNRPAFWYVSYPAPHPPITPPEEYLRHYEHFGVDEPFIGEWAEDFEALPHALKMHRGHRNIDLDSDEIANARMGFYAQCTYVDHQIRLLIGQLREAELLDNTIIGFTSDHGDMLGNHGLWAKPLMHEYSAQVPMILVGAAADQRVGVNRVDNRLAALRDVMPTLLDLCGIDVPPTVEGESLVGEPQRTHLYGEHNDGPAAIRMIRKGAYKLIYYPAGNQRQLFNLDSDRQEMHNLYGAPEVAEVTAELESLMAAELYGEDEAYVKDGHLVGTPAPDYDPEPDRGLSGQRGWR
jgi:arylsulfatase